MWLASGFYIVVEGTRGVVLTFGRYSQETMSGLRWRMPWPIQSHEIVNLAQVRTLEVGYRNNVRTKVLKESLMLTDDENIVDLQFAVQYLVKDARDFVFNVRRPDESAMQIAETAMREIIGKNRMDAILYETAGRRREQGARPDAADPRPLRHRHHGEHASRSRTRSRPSRCRRRSTTRSRPARTASGRRTRASPTRTTSSRARAAPRRACMQEADGYRQRVIANAEGDASRFKQVLTEYAKAPAVTRERIYIETMQAVLTSTSKIMMDYRGAGNLLYLPLDKLMQQRRRAGRRRRTARRPGRAAGRERGRARARRCATASGGSADESARAHRRRSSPSLGAAGLEHAVHGRPAPERDRVPARRGEGGGARRSGLHFKWPLLQNVRLFDMRILTFDDAEPLRFLTQGNRPVLVDSFVKWRIADVRQYYVSVQGDEFRAATRIKQTVAGVLRDEFGARTVHEVVSGERDQIMNRVREKVDQDLKRIGVEIVDVRLKRVDLPQDVSESVYRRMEAERKRIANELRSTGAAEAEKIRADADRQREVILAEAYRDAQRVRGEGDAKSAAIYAAAFNQNPEFYSFYRSMEAYRSTFRGRNDLHAARDQFRLPALLQGLARQARGAQITPCGRRRSSWRSP